MNAQKALVFVVRRLKFECHINMPDDASNPEDTRRFVFRYFNDFCSQKNFKVHNFVNNFLSLLSILIMFTIA